MSSASSSVPFAQLFQQLRYAHEQEVAMLQDQVTQLEERLRSSDSVRDALQSQTLADANSNEGSNNMPIEDNLISGGGGGVSSSSLQSQKSFSSAGSVARKKKHQVLDEMPAQHEKPEAHGVFEATKWLVSHSAFESFFCVLIALNALFIAAETEYDGMQIGFELGHKSIVNTASQEWPGASIVFVIASWFFGILFTLESVLKIIVLRLSFWKDAWNLFDLLIVILFVIGRIGDDNGIPINLTFLRLARLARLFRMLKLVRRIQGFDSLYLMTTAIKGSVGILAWTCCLLFTMEMLLALILNQVLFSVYFNDLNNSPEERQEVFTYFGTFNRAIFSMFELTLANWPLVSRVLAENVSEWFIVLALAHKLTMGFAVLGVINGVFMQEAFKCAATDDTIMLRQKQRAAAVHSKKVTDLFEFLDQTGDGSLDLEEFVKVSHDPKVKDWLAALGVDTSDAENVFRLMDDGDGNITCKELINGLGSLKDGARSIDLLTLVREVRQFKHVADNDVLELKASVYSVTERLSKMFEERGVFPALHKV